MARTRTPQSTNPHRSAPEARGFLHVRLFYVSRRPKPFDQAAVLWLRLIHRYLPYIHSMRVA